MKLHHAVLFLDFDDVLIVPSLHRIKRKRRARDGRKVHYAFVPEACDALLRIMAASPDTAMVVSSTWRLEGRKEVETVLQLNGCQDLSGRFHLDWATGDEQKGLSRADEISTWLKNHPEVERVAAIDDDLSIASQPWGIWIDPTSGLTDVHVVTVLERLASA